MTWTDALQAEMDAALRAHLMGSEHWTSCPHWAEYERLWKVKNRTPSTGWDANGSPVVEEDER